MSSRTLLVEIGCEELPSSSLKSLGTGFHTCVLDGLEQHGLSHKASSWCASPRRLAVIIRELVEQGESSVQESLGPPLAQGKDADGNWTKAASGFAQRLGISPDQLEIIATPKGERLGFRKEIAGTLTRDILRDVVEQALQDLPVAKRMRWGAGRMEFARPIQWTTVLFGDESGFGEIAGTESSNKSYGHRFHAPGAIELKEASTYEKVLRDAFVIADFEQRKGLIQQQVEEEARKLGATVRIDADLLDEVASLVEWPVALAGSFDETFLEVPTEALISAMQKHQKYFPVFSTDGALKAHFITVSNIESRDPSQVIAGNERVIRPRLADTAFFYEQDLKQPLESLLPQLEGVLFQKELGSLRDKTTRLSRLAPKIAAMIDADSVITERAALLCKADLVSQLVLEFGELQGIAGAYYARNDGEDPKVAEAVQQHYWPLQAGSPLPESVESTALALADRLDTLVGIFAIGQVPSGSKDPFALRRAAIAVLRLLIEKELDVDLQVLLQAAADTHKPGLATAGLHHQLQEYMFDRMPALYEKEDIGIEVFRAVKGSGCTSPFEFAARVRAVCEFQEQSSAKALAAANKRVSNILSKAAVDDSVSVDSELFEEAAERALFDSLQALTPQNSESIAQHQYTEALTRLAALKEPVDSFFDQVMVNSDNPALKVNRLSLLKMLQNQFMAIADISELA